MKLTLIFLTAGLLNVCAKGLSQNVSYSGQNVSLETVFTSIKKQTGFVFLYSPSILKSAKPVTVQAKNVDLAEFLSGIFKSQPLDFNIEAKSVFIFPKSVLHATERGDDSTKDVEILPVADTLSTVRGRVSGEKGEPLEGASVFVKELNKGTSTDKSGFYALTNLPKGTFTLVFTYVGYSQITKRISVGSEQTKEFSILMPLANETITDVVVTGYSSKKPTEITGSVQKITGDQLTATVSTPSMLSMLKGKTTGLYISEASSDVNSRGEIFIRGQSTLPNTTTVGPTSPLIVLDGVVMGNIDLQSVVNPQTIESLTILKDAASTAIYGSRAALGVIVITTKAAKQGLAVSLDAKYGTLNHRSRMKTLNTQEWISTTERFLGTQWDELASIRNLYPDKTDFINASKYYTDEEANQYFDWDKAIFDKGNFSDVTVSFRSGGPKSRIYGAAGWYREDGIRLEDKLDRKTFKLNSDIDINQKLSANILVSAIVERTSQLAGIPVSLSTVMPASSVYLPFLSPYNADGSLADSIQTRLGTVPAATSNVWVQNILAEAANFDNTSIKQSETYIGTFGLKYTPIKNLTLRTTNTIRRNIDNTNTNFDSRSIQGRYGEYSAVFLYYSLFPTTRMNGSLNIINANTTSFLSSNTANYTQQFGKNRITLLGGSEFSKARTQTVNTGYYDMLPGERNAAAASKFGNGGAALFGIPFMPNGGETEAALFSAFGEASYGFDQRLFFTASARTDASPSFGENNRYGTFFSLSGAWVVNRENFMRNAKFVDLLKLRYAYGTSGRDLGGFFLNKTFYSNNSGYNGQNNTGSVISQYANPSISWETTFNNSLGIDFGFFKRINGSIDFYHKRSADLIQTVTLPSTQGGFSQQANVGELVNKGVEVIVQANIISTKDFSWDLGLNFSANRNQLSKLINDSIADRASGNLYYRKIGDDVNVIKAVPYVGVNPDNGAPLFEVYDADGKLVQVEGISTLVTGNSQNFRTIGTATPKFFGGFQSSWSYKLFELSTDWYYQVGNYSNMSGVLSMMLPREAYAGSNLLAYTSGMKVWSGAGDNNANLPNLYSSRLNEWRFANQSNGGVWQDASHLRLRNVRVTYNIPQHDLAKAKISSARVYVGADNLFVIKKKSFWSKDPESAFINDSRYGAGYQYFFAAGNTVVNPLRLVAGISIDF